MTPTLLFSTCEFNQCLQEQGGCCVWGGGEPGDFMADSHPVNSLNCITTTSLAHPLTLPSINRLSLAKDGCYVHQRLPNDMHQLAYLGLHAAVSCRKGVTTVDIPHGLQVARWPSLIVFTCCQWHIHISNSI